jgi:predicted HicB family RNase H-like nuclease
MSDKAEKAEETESDTTQYTFRIPRKVKKSLEEAAEKSDRSLSKMIIHILRRYCEENKKA